MHHERNDVASCILVTGTCPPFTYLIIMFAVWNRKPIAERYSASLDVAFFPLKISIIPETVARK